MAQLTRDRNTPERTGFLREYPVKAGAVIFAGSIAGLDATGLAVPMTAATGLVALGRAEKRADNSAGGDGEAAVSVGAGIYRFANSAAADEITAADIGKTCFAADDQTVAKTDGTATRSAAGIVFDVDALGVWVKFS